MRYVLTILMMMLCGGVIAQNGWTRPNASYGFRYYGIGVDSAFFFPTGNGVPTRLGRSDLHMGALYFDSTNNKLYTYNPSTTTWSAVGNSNETLQTITERGDTTDGYLNITGNARYGLDGREGMMMSYNSDERSSYIQSFDDLAGKFHPLILHGNIGDAAPTFTPTELKISDGVYINNVGSGTLSDSIMTQQVSTGKLRRISPNRFDLQQITNAGNLTTSNLNLGGIGPGNVNLNVQYNAGSGFLSMFNNTSSTNGTTVLVANGNTGSSTTLFMATANGVAALEVRGDKTTYMHGDLFINSNVVNMKDAVIYNHLYFVNSTPSVAKATGATWTGTTSISGGRDQSGSITITITSGTGSVSSTGELVNVTFGTTYTGSPKIIVAAADNATAAAFSRMIGTNASTTGWTLTTTPSLSGISAGTYTFYYHIF